MASTSTQRPDCNEAASHTQDGQFLDFTINASLLSEDDDTSTITFKVHRTIISRARYFASCLDSSFRESNEMDINMPEPPEVVAILLEQLYDFPGSHLNNKALAMTFYKLLQLYKAGDIYLLPNTKVLAYRSWTEKFDKAKSACYTVHPKFDLQ